jgi:hypothetical protein
VKIYKKLNGFLAENYTDREKIVEKETSVWSPLNSLDDKKIDAYIDEAINKHSYTKEQALVLLHWNKYDLEKSYADLAMYLPKPNDWTPEEKILFEQAYWLYGKNFNKIRQVVRRIIFYEIYLLKRTLILLFCNYFVNI